MRPVRHTHTDISTHDINGNKRQKQCKTCVWSFGHCQNCYHIYAVRTVYLLLITQSLLPNCGKWTLNCYKNHSICVKISFFISIALKCTDNPKGLKVQKYSEKLIPIRYIQKFRPRVISQKMDSIFSQCHQTSQILSKQVIKQWLKPLKIIPKSALWKHPMTLQSRRAIIRIYHTTETRSKLSIYHRNKWQNIRKLKESYKFDCSTQSPII